MIASTARYIPNRREISYDSIDGEVIIIHLKTGSYYSLEKTGAWVWSHIAVGTDFGKILSLLEGTYPDESNLDSVLSDFIEHLSKEELVVSSPDSTDGAAGNSISTPNNSVLASTFLLPKLNVFTDMQALLLLDPIHEVDEAGWPSSQPADGNGTSTDEETTKTRDASEK